MADFPFFNNSAYSEGKRVSNDKRSVIVVNNIAIRKQKQAGGTNTLDETLLLHNSNLVLHIYY